MTELQSVIRPDGTLIYGQSEELHQYGMEKGHPPIADKLILVDFDQTLVKWGPLMGVKELLPGARETIMTLIARGYRIAIFTSRMSRTWIESVVGKDDDAVAEFMAAQHVFVTETLGRFGIPFEFITAEKVPSEFYIDDKAIGFRGDWTAVLEDSLITGAK